MVRMDGNHVGCLGSGRRAVISENNSIGAAICPKSYHVVYVVSSTLVEDPTTSSVLKAHWSFFIFLM
jgi:hypothetical protein